MAVFSSMVDERLGLGLTVGSASNVESTQGLTLFRPSTDSKSREVSTSEPTTFESSLRLPDGTVNMVPTQPDLDPDVAGVLTSNSEEEEEVDNVDLATSSDEDVQPVGNAHPENPPPEDGVPVFNKTPVTGVSWRCEERPLLDVSNAKCVPISLNNGSQALL